MGDVTFRLGGFFIASGADVHPDVMERSEIPEARRKLRIGLGPISKGKASFGPPRCARSLSRS
jgi:hypothetical protein